jgi:hypothetical protein
VALQLAGEASRGWRTTFCCGNWSFAKGRGWNFDASFQWNVDIFKNAARSNGTQAVALDEVVALASFVFSAEWIGEMKRLGELSRLDYEASAVSRPVVRLFFHRSPPFGENWGIKLRIT